MCSQYCLDDQVLRAPVFDVGNAPNCLSHVLFCCMLDDNVLLHAKGIMFACFTCYQICLDTDVFASSVRPGWNWHVGLLAF
jgi:hypothetical protein